MAEISVKPFFYTQWLSWILFYRYYFEYIGIANEEKDYDSLKNWMDKLHRETLQFDYVPPNAQGMKQRLKQLKIKYDPDNVFHHVERNIDPEN